MKNIYHGVIDLLSYYKQGKRANLTQQIMPKIFSLYNIKLSDSKKNKIIYRVLDALKTLGIIEIFSDIDGEYWIMMDDCLVYYDREEYILFGKSTYTNNILSQCDLYQESNIDHIYINENYFFAVNFKTINIKEELLESPPFNELVIINNNYKKLWQFIPDILSIKKNLSEVNLSVLQRNDKVKLYDFDEKKFNPVGSQNFSEGFYEIQVKYSYPRYVLVTDTIDVKIYEIENNDWKFFLAHNLLRLHIKFQYKYNEEKLLISRKSFHQIPYLVRRALCFRDVLSCDLSNELLVFNSISKNVIETLKNNYPFMVFEAIK